MKNELQIINLSCQNLKDINFSLNGGSFVALTGKNRSGKTTLLKCIAGILNYSGTIKLNDDVITNSQVLNKNIGIYLNNINLSEGTVFNNLIEPLINLNISEDQAKKKIYEILKKLKIEYLIYKVISNLSYSEKKIVSIAKSIIHNPKVILLDNPFESLDEYNKTIIIKYLEKLKSTKNTIIVFTSNNSEDLLFSNNIIVLNDGKIVFNDSRDNAFENENVFIKNGIKLPFIIDLSHKLKSYELIDHIVYDSNEMVDEIWK